MKRSFLAIASVAALLLLGAPATGAASSAGKTPVQFDVLAKSPASLPAAVRAVRAAGGKVTRVNRAVGLISATAPRSGFRASVGRSSAVYGVTAARPIGRVPTSRPAAKFAVEREAAFTALQNPTATLFSATTGQPWRQAEVGMDPLDSQLWGLTAVRSNLSRTVQPGDNRVEVGIIDTGIDGSHPDIAPNFDRADSRNFTHDIPTDELGQVVDGPCEFRGCVDPADHDDGGHGTHVAGTVGAAANGGGVSGVAPNVTLVNIRAGQDSGYFFLQPTVDALTYAGDAGIDVVNMSFFVDPWLYNCQNNPADSPEQQAQQRLIIVAMTRAMNYAHSRGVTQVVSLGNQHTDLGNPQPDTISPDFPDGTAHPRTIDNATCLSLPVEGPHSISVSALGPSMAKADYSNYGTEQISVSAPGGWFRDYFGTPQFRTNENLILSAYPHNVGIAEGNIDAAGNITPQGVALGVQKATFPNGSVGYYQFLQGTSMASPHAAGVAALIVSEYGKAKKDGKKNHWKNKKKKKKRKAKDGFGMSPDAVQRVLEGTAFNTPCPVPNTVDYLDEGRDATWTATCTGTPDFNGFYGHGVVDAWAAVTRGRDVL